MLEHSQKAIIISIHDEKLVKLVPLVELLKHHGQVKGVGVLFQQFQFLVAEMVFYVVLQVEHEW